MELIEKKKLIDEISRLQDETMDACANFHSEHDQGAYDMLAKVEYFVEGLEVVELKEQESPLRGS